MEIRYFHDMEIVAMYFLLFLLLGNREEKFTRREIEIDIQISRKNKLPIFLI